ncbi:MAG: biopolymer transporter ExbD [Gammaproteobacteria bacterium]
MAMGQLDRSGSPQPMSEINVTPLVDVMLVLLIIFIVTAPLLSHKVKLNLPKATTQPQTIEDPLVVSLAKDTQLYVDDQPVTGEQLQGRLEGIVAAGKQPIIEVRADGTLEYQYVVRLMALIQNAGVTKVSFVTQPGAANTALTPADQEILKP